MDERDDGADAGEQDEEAAEAERVPRAERERVERERAERERVERAERAERERAEWLERERVDRAERADRERSDRERADRSERDRAERERLERERAERAERELPESLRQRLEAMVPEMVKRTFSAGLGALFSTEENIRKLAKDVSIPDVAGYLASTADSTKDKVLEVVARELRNFLEQVNLSEELAKLLTTLSFEIRTEIRFVPNTERYSGVDPSVKASVKLKRNDKAVTSDKGEKGERADRPDKADRPDDDRGSRLRFWRRGSTANGEDSGERPAADLDDAQNENVDDERTAR